MGLSNSRIKELERAEIKLRALESGGVDNWEFYDVSLSGYYRQVTFEDDISDLVYELASIILAGVHEPSKRGAGYATTDDALKSAEECLMEKVHDLMAPDGDK